MLSILLNVFVKLTNVLSKSAASSSLSDVGLARCGTWILWPLLWIFFNGGRLLCQFGQLGQLGHAFSFTGDSVCCWASSLYLCGNHICLPNVPQPTLFLRSNLTKTLSDVADPPLFTLSRCAQAIFRCCWSTSGEGSQSSPSLSPSLGSPSLYLLSLRSFHISQITLTFIISYHMQFITIIWIFESRTRLPRMLWSTWRRTRSPLALGSFSFTPLNFSPPVSGECNDVDDMEVGMMAPALMLNASPKTSFFRHCRKPLNWDFRHQLSHAAVLNHNWFSRSSGIGLCSLMARWYPSHCYMSEFPTWEKPQSWSLASDWALSSPHCLSSWRGQPQTRWEA